MKIAYVTQPYDGVLPPRQNSIGLIVYNTALEVARRADVTLYVQRAHSGASTAGLPFDVALTRARGDELLQGLARRYPRWASRLGLSARADAHLGWARAVARGLRRAPADIVHVMNYWGWSESLRAHRIVLEMQSEWLSQMPRVEVARQLRHVAAVTTVSGHVERLFRAAFPDYPGAVEIVPNGVDTDVFRPAPASESSDARLPRRVVFVGRMSPEKGVHTLLEAFATVAAHLPDVHLDLVGPRTELPMRFLVGLSDDPAVRALERFYDAGGASHYQRHLDDLVERGGLRGRVTFHGSLPHHDIVAVYQRASLVVNPSLSETFGISIVEGMACGIPVVGTRVGGMLDTIVDEVGRAVPAEAPAALAEAMGALLADSARARALGAAGRQRAVRRFTWAARAAGLLRLYERVAHGQTAPIPDRCRT